jgi:hypothetical protein
MQFRKIDLETTCISLTLYSQRGSSDISDIPPKHPHFTKIVNSHNSLFNLGMFTYIHTYHSRFIPEAEAEVFQIFRDSHVLTKLVSYEEHCRRDRW